METISVAILPEWICPHQDYDYEATNDHDSSMPGFTFDGKGHARRLEWKVYGVFPYYTYKLEAEPGSSKYTKNGDELTIDLSVSYYMGQEYEIKGAGVMSFYYDRDYNVLAIEDHDAHGQRGRLTYKKQ